MQDASDTTSPITARALVSDILPMPSSRRHRPTPQRVVHPMPPSRRRLRGKVRIGTDCDRADGHKRYALRALRRGDKLTPLARKCLRRIGDGRRPFHGRNGG